MTVVTVLTVKAVCRHLIRCTLVKNGNRAVLNSRINSTQMLKHFLYLIGACRGGDIVVVNREAEQAVSHSTANGIRLIPTIVQRINYIFHSTRQINFHHFDTSLNPLKILFCMDFVH